MIGSYKSIKVSVYVCIFSWNTFVSPLNQLTHIQDTKLLLSTPSNTTPPPLASPGIVPNCKLGCLWLSRTTKDALIELNESFFLLQVVSSNKNSDPFHLQHSFLSPLVAVCCGTRNSSHDDELYLLHFKAISAGRADLNGKREKRPELLYLIQASDRIFFFLHSKRTRLFSRFISISFSLVLPLFVVFEKSSRRSGELNNLDNSCESTSCVLTEADRDRSSILVCKMAFKRWQQQIRVNGD